MWEPPEKDGVGHCFKTLERKAVMGLLTGWLSGILGTYLEFEKEVVGLARKKPNKLLVLAHALANVGILNIGAALIKPNLTPDAAPYLYALSILTFASIIIIEAVVYRTALGQGGRRGRFWNQLEITNFYLTPVFLLFFVFFVINRIGLWFFLLDVSIYVFYGFYLAVITVFSVMVLRMNDRKIKALHGIEKTETPNLAYAIGCIMAYLAWTVVFVAFLLTDVFSGGALLY